MKTVRLACNVVGLLHEAFYTKAFKDLKYKAISLVLSTKKSTLLCFNPVALRKAKIIYNFGLSECNRVNIGIPKKDFPFVHDFRCPNT